MAFTTEYGEVVWIDYDNKEVIIKHDTKYLFQDQTMSIYDMGDSLSGVKEILEKIGRDDVIEELVEQGILKIN